MVTGHEPLYVCWCLIPFREAAKSLMWPDFEFKVRATDGLQICHLKPPELGTI